MKKHWKNITIFIFFTAYVFSIFFEKNVYFSNVFSMFYFLKTLEKHWKNKVFFINKTLKNINKTLEKKLPEIFSILSLKKNIVKTLEKHWKNIGKTLEKHWIYMGILPVA